LANQGAAVDLKIDSNYTMRGHESLHDRQRQEGIPAAACKRHAATFEVFPF
jgi:hypothetical protein